MSSRVYTYIDLRLVVMAALHNDCTTYNINKYM